MRTIKPQRLGITCRTYEHAGRCRFVPSVLAFFDLDRPDALLPEVVMWEAVSPHLGPGAVLDEGLPKPHGEVLVTGQAYPVEPGGTSVDCAFAVGPVKKTLRVYGERHWRGLGGMTDPGPVAGTPIDYAHAFGGEGFDRNPVGLGAEYPKRVEVPHVEHPDHPIRSADARPEPASFEAIPVDWPQRRQYDGTYDARWLEEHFPGFAEDHDPRAFNLAPPDQWHETFFRGDETITVTGMHPDRPVIDSKLPGIAARVFVELWPDENDAGTIEEIPMKLDTVRLYPHLVKGLMVFRGMLPVRDDQGHEIRRLLVAADWREEPRPVAHYHEVLRRREDKQSAALEALDDRPLVPAGIRAEIDHTTETQHGAFVVPREGLLEAHVRARAEGELKAMRERMIDQGLDPAEHGVPETLPEPAPPPPQHELKEFVEEQRALAEEKKQEAERAQAEAEAQARATCEAQGLDYEAMKAAQSAVGPPDFSAEAQLEELRERAALLENAGADTTALRAQLADPAFVARLKRAEVLLRDGYRKSAHRTPRAATRPDEASAMLRVRVEAAKVGDESLEGSDWTGCDLRGLDLSGLSLRGVLMENARLDGCNFDGADLTEAVLAYAEAAGARFDGANLTGANLGSASLVGARLAGAILDGATLDGAKLHDVHAEGASFVRATWLETVVSDSDFRRATFDHAIFQQATLRQVNLSEAQLVKAVFVECTLADVKASRARLEETCFVGVSAEGLILTKANLASFRVVNDSELLGADLRRCHAVRANFRGTRMAGAKLTGGELLGADFSECALEDSDFTGARAREARFERASLRGARFDRCDLLEAIFAKADVAGATFDGANLFRADFARATGDEDTSFEGALTKRVRIVKGTVGVPG